MSTDSLSEEKSTPRVDLRVLPEVIELHSVRIQYETPRITYVDRKPKKISEAVEIRIEVNRAYAMSAVSPALYIGDQVVKEYRSEGDKTLCFYLYDFANVREGTSISIGWADSPKERKETGYLYKVEESK